MLFPIAAVHAQIGSGQSVIMKWASAHYYNYYVSVVPAKYQSVFHGSENSNHPLREYQSILEVRSQLFISTHAPCT